MKADNMELYLPHFREMTYNNDMNQFFNFE